MPIDVVCPKCQSRLRAPDEVFGKSVRCKKCQEKFKVPNPGPPVDSVGDTQQLSVLEMPPPKIVPAKPVAAEPMMLDESAFDDPLPAVVAAAKPTVVVVDKVDEDRPRKKKRPREDDEDEDDRPRKKKDKPKPVIGGEPTFAMPGAAEDPVLVHVPPPAHASQFSFEQPAPVSKRREDDDEDDDRPRKKKKRHDEDDDVPKKKPAKRSKTLLILGVVAVVLFLGCGGAVAGVYFFFIKVADDVSKSTWTVGTAPVTKENTNSRPTKAGAKPTNPTPQAGGPVETPFALPEGGESKGAVVAAGTQIALPFAPDFVKQIQKFKDPEFGAMIYAVYQSNPGFNGAGSEDTIVRFDIGKKTAAGQFTVPADGFPGPRIFDISDSGYRVAIEAPKGRLTIYNFADKVTEIPIDVHAGLTGREGIAGIAFADPTGSRVAIVDKLGAVDVWDVKERQRIATGKPDAGNAVVVAERRKPNAGKGHLASKDWIRGVLWNKGDMESPIKLPAKTGIPTLLAAKESHDHFAIVHLPEGSSEREVLVVDKSGAAVWRIPLSATAGAPRSLQWMGGGATLAVGFEPAIGLLLLDFASKTPAVYTKPGQDKTVLGDTGEVYVVPDPKVPGKAALVQTSVPGPALIDAAKASKVPERLYAKPEGLSQ